MAKRWFVLIIAFILLFGFIETTYGIKPFPVKEYVTDQAQLLSESERQQLSQQLWDYFQTTGNQLLVITIPSLEGEDVTDFAQQLFELNKPGKKGKDNGLILLIALREHKLWISVGYGLEERVPDGKAGAIRDQMFPYFRNGDYNTGIAVGINLLIKAITPEYQVGNDIPIQIGKERDRSLPIAFIVALVIFVFSFFGNLGRGARTHQRRFSRGYSEPWFWGGGFGGGGFGGGGSSGGGFSGGGGSFGGGGAGGSW